MRKILILPIILLLGICVNAQVTNVTSTFSCPGKVTITYDLNTTQPTDVILYYSHNKRDWLIATTVTGNLTAQTTGTGKTIIWDNAADNVKFGKFYFKLEIPQPPEPECVMINGVCWATRNVDAPGTFTANPEDYGMYYQWNRKVGWSSSSPMINSNGGTVWDNTVPTGTTWETANDPCPAGWRVPTKAEAQSLVDAGSVWTTLNGVNGRLFGTAPNQVFFPTAGYRSGGNYGTLVNQGIFGYYWNSTPDVSSFARILLFFSSFADVSADSRNNGLSVRCVKE